MAKQPKTVLREAADAIAAALETVKEVDLSDDPVALDRQNLAVIELTSGNQRLQSVAEWLEQDHD